MPPVKTSTDVSQWVHSRRKLERRDNTSTKPISLDMISRTGRLPTKAREGFALQAVGGGQQRKEKDTMSRLKIASQKRREEQKRAEEDTRERESLELVAEQKEEEDIKPFTRRKQIVNSEVDSHSDEGTVVDVSMCDRVKEEGIRIVKGEFILSSSYDSIPVVEKEEPTYRKRRRSRGKEEKGKGKFEDFGEREDSVAYHRFVNQAYLSSPPSAPGGPMLRDSSTSTFVLPSFPSPPFPLLQDFDLSGTDVSFIPAVSPKRKRRSRTQSDSTSCRRSSKSRVGKRRGKSLPITKQDQDQEEGVNGVTEEENAEEEVWLEWNPFPLPPSSIDPNSSSSAAYDTPAEQSLPLDVGN